MNFFIVYLLFWIASWYEKITIKKEKKKTNTIRFWRSSKNPRHYRTTKMLRGCDRDVSHGDPPLISHHRHNSVRAFGKNKKNLFTVISFTRNSGSTTTDCLMKTYTTTTIERSLFPNRAGAGEMDYARQIRVTETWFLGIRKYMNMIRRLWLGWNKTTPEFFHPLLYQYITWNLWCISMTARHVRQNTREKKEGFSKQRTDQHLKIDGEFKSVCRSLWRTNNIIRKYLFF